ncbi:LCP family protein [Nocardioides speluncae]|uniref:LCP family protein n=1 Tax=Nocardioides speluncae TaxID=2670337 RepID=UPI000D69DC2D|nr:LCP family protein [Nocardioides speluncae]
MADRPRGNGTPAEGTPEYNWLYGQREPASPDSEATEIFPGWGSPDQPTQPAAPAPPPPDRTQVLPVQQQPYNQPPPPPQPPQPPPGQTPYRQPPPPPTAPGHGPGPGLPLPRRPRIRFRPVRWVMLLLLLWLVFLIATPFWAWRSVDKVDAEPSGERPGDQPGTTYLIVGSDSRQGLTKEERDELGTGNPSSELTDTIMLLHTGDGPNLLMSIPRDSLVNIPGSEGKSKINGAYGKGGPELVVQTIEQNTGIRVDHYVEIGLGGFVGLVDAVGGVEICPKKAMKDPKANLDIKKGCQEADGVTALGYARSRKFATGDIERAEHQREVVSAVGKKAVSPWSVVNPIRYWKLNMAATDFITTDENTGPTKLAGFALAMTRLDGDNGMTCGVPIADLAVNWDEKRSKQMFEYIQNDETDKIGKLCNKSGLVTGP